MHNLNRKLLEQNETHADVTFVFPDGTNVRAHRAILGVRSPVLLFHISNKYYYILFFY
jgi:hypothetical protein